MSVEIDNRSDDQGLAAWLLANGHRCTFFKLLYELERLGYVGPRRLTIHPLASNVFPARDIHAVVFDDKADRSDVIAWFGGLFGVDSPLPSYFDDILAEETPRAAALESLLVLVGNRFYHLLHEIWSRMSPIFASEEAVQECVRQPALSLCGLEHLREARFDALATVPYIAQGMHSRWGLKGLLEEYLNVSISVREFEHVEIPIRDNERTRLGNGSTAVLGRSFRSLPVRESCTTHIRVICGPLSLDAYTDLLKGGILYEWFAYLLHRYLPEDLEYRVELVLSAKENGKLSFVLGDKLTRLGATTVIRKGLWDRPTRITREGLSLSNQPELMRSIVSKIEGASLSRPTRKQEAHLGQA